MITKIARLVVCVLAVSSVSAATTWYVDDSTGSDLPTHGSAASPFATIQYAIDHPSVMDGDTLDLNYGWYMENVLIDKSLTLFDGYITITGFTGVPATGMVISADDVTLSYVDIEADFSLTGSGTMVRAAKASGPISGLTLDDVLIDATWGSAENCTGLEIIRPRGLQTNMLDVRVGLGFDNPANVHNGIRIVGGAPDGATRNELAGNWVTADALGYGLRLEPGSGESVNGFDILSDYISGSNGIVYDVRDTDQPGEGISDIRFLGGIVHSNHEIFRFTGQAGDAGPGISDVLIEGFWEMGWSTHSIVVTEEGVGATNIDLSSFKVRQSNIYLDSDHAVMNQVATGTLDCAGNFWGGALGANAAGGDTTTGAVITEPYLDRYIDSRFYDDVAAGGTADFYYGPMAVNFTANPGVSGHIAIAYMDDYPGWGWAGMGGATGLDFSFDIDSDIPDGDFLALIRIAYTDFDITNAGIDESQIAVFHFVTGTGWNVTVEDNVGGTAQWMGDSAPPSLPLDPSDLGKHGVDMTNNIVWAVVDHFTEFTGGESNMGVTVPVELSVFSVD